MGHETITRLSITIKFHDIPLDGCTEGAMKVTLVTIGDKEGGETPPLPHSLPPYVLWSYPSSEPPQYNMAIIRGLRVSEVGEEPLHQIH